MATNYLDADQMVSDLDQSQVQALEILAEHGQDGLDAYEEAQAGAEELSMAAGQSWEEMVGTANAPDAALAELNALGESWSTPLEEVRDMQYEGFESRMNRLKGATTARFDEFRDAAPTYERIGQEAIAKKAAAREAARLAEIEKAKREADRNFGSALQNFMLFNPNFDWASQMEYGGLMNNRPEIELKVETMPPQLSAIYNQMNQPTNDLYIPLRIIAGQAADTLPLMPEAMNVISTYLLATYPDMDPNIFLSYITE